MAQDHPEDGYKDYLGIPRKEIPWFPSVDPDACTGCRNCVQACKHGVYEFDEEAQVARVVNPYHCEVYCQSCQFQCDAGAISFPNKARVKDIVRVLRETYPPKA